jgi:hypothetical protein
MTNLTDTAYHEAAHAVAADRRGALVDHVTIAAHDDILGHSRSEDFFPGDEGEDRACVIELLAGLAVDLERGVAEDDARNQARDDLEDADYYLTLYGWTETEMLAEARAFVRANWPAITAVAEQLLIDTTLDFDELAIVIGAADGELDEPLAEALRQFRRLKRKCSLMSIRTPEGERWPAHTLRRLSRLLGGTPDGGNRASARGSTQAHQRFRTAPRMAFPCRVGVPARFPAPNRTKEADHNYLVIYELV